MKEYRIRQKAMRLFVARMGGKAYLQHSDMATGNDQSIEGVAYLFRAPEDIVEDPQYLDPDHPLFGEFKTTWDWDRWDDFRWG